MTVHHDWRTLRLLQQIDHKLDVVLKNQGVETEAMAKVNDMLNTALAAAADESTQIASLIAFNTSVVQQVRDLTANQLDDATNKQISDLLNAIQNNDRVVAAAVVANTPQAPANPAAAPGAPAAAPGSVDLTAGANPVNANDVSDLHDQLNNGTSTTQPGATTFSGTVTPSGTVTTDPNAPQTVSPQGANPSAPLPTDGASGGPGGGTQPTSTPPGAPQNVSTTPGSTGSSGVPGAGGNQS